VLLAFYDYPAEHWIHLRTTNPIESTFATIRLRQRVTQGPGSRAAGTAMAFKLIESAQRRWRAVNAPHLVALVRAGADKGRIVERPDDQPDHESGDDAEAARTLNLWVANEICPLTATDLPAVVTTWRS
jgi:putative transposase